MTPGRAQMSLENATEQQAPFYQGKQRETKCLRPTGANAWCDATAGAQTVLLPSITATTGHGDTASPDRRTDSW